MAEKKPEAKADAEAAGGKKKPPLMIIMAVFAVVVLGAGFFLVQKASAKQKGGGASKPVEKGPVMPLDEFLVNLADPGADHFLKVTVGLELDKDTGKTPETLKDDIPLIRDAVIASLSSKTRDQLGPESGRDKLKTEIKKRVNDALGEKDVQGVYFTNFVTQ